MSGAGRRKYAALKRQKPEDNWTEEEKTFMRFADLAKSSRKSLSAKNSQQVPQVKTTPKSSLEHNVVNESSFNASSSG